MPRNSSCTDCELHKEAKNVCLWGVGPKKAKVMIIGEAPGATEDKEGLPFVGQSGKLLREELYRVGINPEDVYITNTVKCRPAGNDKPKAGQMKACKKYIDEEIATVQPEYVVTLGAVASKGILKKAKITEVHGKVIDFPNFKAMAAYHPAYCLYDPSKLPVLRKDLKRFAETLQGIKQTREKFKWRKITDESLGEFWTELGNCEWFAFDLETQSLNWFDPKHKITVFSISMDKGGGSWILPVTLMDKAVDWLWPKVKAFIKRVAEKVRKWRKKGVAHNGKFDNHWLYRKCDIIFPLDFDTMLASHTINENRAHALDSLATEYLDAPYYDIPLSEKQGWIKPEEIDKIQRLYRYAAKDTFYTLQLRPLMQKELEEDKQVLRLFNRLIMRAARSFHEIEDVGMKILMDKFATNRTRVAKDRDESLITLNAMVKDEVKRVGPRKKINWNSPQQVAKLLFEDLKLPIIELTDGGAPSTGEATLVALKDKHPVANQLVKYRELEKFLSTYFDGWKELMHEDRVYFSYKLHGTVTGRYASRLHQTPRDGTIRNCVDAPEGWTFVQGDFSQAELRVAAIVSGDPELIYCFSHGIDVHWRTLLYVVQSGGAGEYVQPAVDTAYKLLKKRNPTTKRPNFNQAIEVLLKAGHEKAIEIWEGWKEARKKAKGINFGFVYGMREQKFIEYAKLKYGFEPTEEEAAMIRRAYFQLYRGLGPWHDRMKRLVKLDGFVRSLSGRLRRLPGISSREYKVRAENERQAINSPIQGFIGDFKAMALVELCDKLDPQRSKVVGEVHDAILFWVKTEHLKEELPKIAKIMQNPELVKEFKIKLPVPIDVELDSGPWGQRGNVKWIPEAT